MHSRPTDLPLPALPTRPSVMVPVHDEEGSIHDLVAKSTHAGIPSLLFIRRALGDRVHFWPFDGWDVPMGRTVILEVYPRLWSAGYSVEDHTPDQHDDFSVVAGPSAAEADGRLLRAMTPGLSPPEMAVAKMKGWILGVPCVPTKEAKPSAKPTTKPTAKVGSASGGGKTTKAGYVNKSGQEVLRATDLPGNDCN